MKKEKKICIICKKLINPKIQNWNSVFTYTREHLDGVHYFHDVCYAEMITNGVNQSPQKALKNLMDRTNLLLDNLGVEKVVRVGV